MRQYFNPRSPHGERQAFSACLRRGCPYFNPRSPHGERPAHQSEDDDKPHISIHAPRMGSDQGEIVRVRVRQYFNPRPRMGSDVNPSTPVVTMGIFQSTPPAWGATVRLYFPLNVRRISIHAPRMGSDVSCECISARQAYFNPRSRMGSGGPLLKRIRSMFPFQSTLPHGERPSAALHHSTDNLFQSTLPHGERRVAIEQKLSSTIFQSTLPHGERLGWLSNLPLQKIFQSTLPHGERQQKHEISSLFL